LPSSPHKPHFRFPRGICDVFISFDRARFLLPDAAAWTTGGPNTQTHRHTWTTGGPNTQTHRHTWTTGGPNTQTHRHTQTHTDNRRT